MIVVDTSIWIDAFRDSTSAEAKTLSSLLDDDEVLLAAPVRLELIAGARKREQGMIEHLLAALPILIPQESTWRLVEAWIKAATARREKFGVMDLLIAASAFENDATIWSKGEDFKRIESLGFVARFRPRT